MKLIIILLLFPFVTWGQNLFPSKGVRRTTTPNNGKFVDSPSFNSESRTISNKATKEKTNYKIYTKEYVDQKHIPDEFELTEFAYPKKGKYCVLDLDSGYIKLSTCENFLFL